MLKKKNKCKLRRKRAFFVALLIPTFFAALCQNGCQSTPPPTPPSPQFNFTPRIGDTPPTPQVDAARMNFQITTRVTNQQGQNAVGLALTQELVITQEYYRNGQLIVLIQENRHEMAPTNNAGDWVDKHAAVSRMMDVLNADQFTHSVQAHLFTQRLTAGPAQLPMGVFRRTFTHRFGPEATSALRKTILAGIPQNQNTGHQYQVVQTGVRYSYTWNVKEVIIEEEGVPVVVRTGDWGIAFWTPLSAFSLNQRITF